ncbi:MAG: PspC domain-containing protein [Bacteroides sp.]|nr:PspC domain-containing protein [Bacteroides sp.]
MKKTFNINVAGFPFTIDEDAYSLLNDYIKTLEHAFEQQEDGTEVVSDIESRIAELLLECTSSGSPIVTLENVEEVISRVGKPEEMFEDEIKVSVNDETGATTVTDSETQRISPPPYIPPLPPLKRKLYRDPQNSMLGGVCSGMAWFLKVDPTWVRLITVILTIASFATCSIAYLILWIVIPEARTPLERMEMMGEEPTVENIGKTVTGNFRDDNHPAAHTSNSANTFGSTIAKIFSILVKVIIVIGMILAVILLGALVIGLLGCVFALIMFGTSWGGTVFGEISPIIEEAGSIPVYGLVCGIGSILTIGIPLYLLIRKGWNNPTPLSGTMKTTLTILWIIGFTTAAITAGRIINIQYEQERKWRENRHNHNIIIESEEESAEITLDTIPAIPTDSINLSATTIP